MLYKVLHVFDMVRGLANQRVDDVGQLLSHLICDGPPTGENGPEGVLVLYTLGRP